MNNLSKIKLGLCITAITGCVQLMSVDDKIEQYPPRDVKEICNYNIKYETLNNKKICLENLNSTIGTPEPESIATYHAQRKKDDEERKARETIKSINASRIEQEREQRRQDAEAARLAEIGDPIGLTYGGELSKSLWDAQVNGFQKMKGKFFLMDLPFKITICNKETCLVSIPMAHLSFSIVRENGDFIGMYVVNTYATPVGTDSRGNLVMRRIQQ